MMIGRTPKPKNKKSKCELRNKYSHVVQSIQCPKWHETQNNDYNDRNLNGLS